MVMAGEAARGATVYVTLEPCCHVGRAPPCTEALIAAGVARVVVAMRDCDPRVNGQGIVRLRDAGIVVQEGLLADEAAELNAGFVSRLRRGRPLLTLKLASTLDGRIATRGGESRWITGEAARRAGHAMRGRHDAIMVGVGTVLTDDPELTCRLPGFRPVPLVRVVTDSHLRTPLTARLVATAAETPTWIIARDGTDPERRRALSGAGVGLIEVDGADAGVDLHQGLRALADRGITRLLVEGGAQLAAALLRADLVDRLVWFHAPGVMGGDGWPAAQAFGVRTLAEMPRFDRQAATQVGDDMLTELRRAA
jgi:diaminohydroxyphosphoribosylaminopyrimidine deaminase/5-amino-6-(5-phosphoribosylamino)uracil reductase